LYTELFHTDEVAELLSDRNFLVLMLRAESALAEAQAKNGIISPKSAEIIAECCDIKAFNLEKLKKEIKLSGNAAIPLVRQLTGIVGSKDAEAARRVHFGATSQDIVDTATVLQMQGFLTFVQKKIEKIQDTLGELGAKHRTTVMAGRTLLQQAKPITFALKIVGWIDCLTRTCDRMDALKHRLLCVQLGGAVGSGNAQIPVAVQDDFAAILGLNRFACWHTQRDNIAEFAAVMGILCGSLAKIAKDVSLLMQTEIGEVLEGSAEGKGGSSTMPHKRNPVTCTAILANTHRVPFLVATVLAAMPQENERSAGLWHAEWEPLKDLMQLTAGTLQRTDELTRDLEVNRERMLQNLELTNGLIYAEQVSLGFAAKMGKAAAHELVEEACKTAVSEQKHLKDVLLALPNLPLNSAEIGECFKPENAIGRSIQIVDDFL
jgi:3-carboxy-cis,cis-muconate cycloisomerase